MKRATPIDTFILIARYYLVKISDTILDPLEGIPVPDFNNQYDPHML